MQLFHVALFLYNFVILFFEVLFQVFLIDAVHEATPSFNDKDNNYRKAVTYLVVWCYIYIFYIFFLVAFYAKGLLMMCLTSSVSGSDKVIIKVMLVLKVMLVIMLMPILNFTYKGDGFVYLMDVLKYIFIWNMFLLTSYITLLISTKCSKVSRQMIVNIEETTNVNIYKNIISKYNTDTCIFCLDEFEAEDKVLELPCGHIFHENCCNRWLFDNENKCPMCNQ